MRGLYALKHWFGGILTPVKKLSLRFGISPNLLTTLGVLSGALGGWAMAHRNTLLVAASVILRLAFANLDGAVARELGRQSKSGFWINEAGDRLADWAIFTGVVFLPGVDVILWLAFMIAIAMPTFVSLAVVKSRESQNLLPARINSGPFGKTERCLFAVLLVWLGASQVQAFLFVAIVLSVATALIRFVGRNK